MERFDWLEVDKPKPKEQPAASEEFDARHYLIQAEKAYRRGNYEFALKHYGKALGERPDLAEAWLGQVLCLVELGELEEARVWSSKALDAFPESPELLAGKGLVMAKLGQNADAAALSDRAIAKKAADSRVWLLRGLTFLALDPEGRRDGCFSKALEEGPKDGAFELRIGMGYLDQGSAVSAKAHLELAAEKDSDNPLAWRKLGECLERLRFYERAGECYERALALKPEGQGELCAAVGRLKKRGAGHALVDLWRALWGPRRE